MCALSPSRARLGHMNASGGRPAKTAQPSGLTLPLFFVTFVTFVVQIVDGEEGLLSGLGDLGDLGGQIRGLR